MTRHITMIFAALGAAALALGCTGESSDKVEYERQILQFGGFDGVDLLIAVDDSVSMTEEQAILATAFFPLVNALASPIQTEFPESNWPYPAADELRIAVVTSNMGLSAGGEEMDDHWPGDVPSGCAGTGADGVFQGFTQESVTIQNDVIPCDATAAQCPPDWTCAGVGAATGVGVCHTDGSTDVACSGLAGPWAESSNESPNLALVAQGACLSRQGTDGCEIEQPLQSIARALARSDQEEFLRESHLLAILVVSDEDDCSVQDAWIDGAETGLFEEEEVAAADAGALDLACGNHPEDLLPAAHFYDAFVERKGPGSIVFAAIAGVPYGSQEGAGACQGPGDQLYECLAQDEMQLVPEQPNLPDDASWQFAPACTRSVGEDAVTRAAPGRRFVELANASFGNMSYVYSICNADWSPAMAEVARMIAYEFAGMCFENRIAWDSTGKVAACDVVVEYVNAGETCPEIFGPDAVPVIEHETSAEGEEITFMYCPIPKIPFELDCADQAADEDVFGWYYCENLAMESFDEACADDVDNDADGVSDCADDECATCPVCGGAGDECALACKHTVGLTKAVRTQVAGLQIDIQCEIAEAPAE